MKIRLALGLLGLVWINPGVADSCAPIARAASAYAKAERYAVKISMVSKGETLLTEVMMAPEGMYIRAGEQWIRSPVSISRRDLLNAGKAAYSDCRRMGEEAIDGTPTAVYRFTGKAEDQPPMTGSMWIGIADDLPRRLEAKTQDADITQSIRYDVQPPKNGAAGLPVIDQLKGLFGK